MASGYDIFLSHSSVDKPWVGQLNAALDSQQVRVFLDEADIRPPDNFVLSLNDALRDSRFLVLVVSPNATGSKWVEQEWTSFMAEHGPVGRIVTVLLESAELPPLLATVQQIDATDRNVDRVAGELVALVGRAGELKDGDARRLFIGQDLTFVIAQNEKQLHITDPLGKTREVKKPWGVDHRFGRAFFGFNQLTKRALEEDAERAELYQHARTLGQLLFELLFDTEDCAKLLKQACIPGRPRPLVTIRSDDDVLLSLPWELLWQDESFLVRDARIDMARSTLGEVGPAALLREPTGYFKLVVNVSAPEGSGLNYEGESYRITRALSEHCELVPTELGTVDDLIETVRKSGPTGVHFSGHGSPGRLVFENEEGREAPIAISELMDRLRARLPDGGLPPFFYLASCHGNEPAVPEEGQSGSECSATLLHRKGVPQVVGYYGPIADELSTRAEEALYAAIAEGHPTRYAVRQARQALAADFWGPDQKHRPAGPARDPQSSVATTHPFGWAQLVFYHRGPDHPLSLPVPADETRRVELHLQRTFEGLGNRKRLSTGFIGRRTELHRIRRRLRRGDRVLVFQGLGGLGKTTLAFHTLPLLAAEEDVCTLWCQEAEHEENPAEQVVGQLLAYCRQRFGVDWEGVVQQVDRAATDNSVLRFQYFLQALLQNVSGLVVYLDNMESLLVGPQASDGPESDEFATWRSDELREIWESLASAATDTGKLHVVASCRYRHDDFNRHTIPVSPLPPTPCIG